MILPPASNGGAQCRRETLARSLYMTIQVKWDPLTGRCVREPLVYDLQETTSFLFRWLHEQSPAYAGAHAPGSGQSS